MGIGFIRRLPLLCVILTEVMGERVLPILFDFMGVTALMFRVGGNCGALISVAAQRITELVSVVRINLGVVAAPRNGYVSQPGVYKLLTFFCVHMNQCAVSSLALAAMACHSIAIIKMGMVFDFEPDRPS